MNKLILIGVLSLIQGGWVNCQAQLLIGAAGIYGDDIQEPGVNLRLYYYNNGKICFGPEFSLFNSHKEIVDGEEVTTKLWEFNFNGHYIFETTERLGLYPLVGLNVSRETEDIEGLGRVAEETSLGVNVGAGAHYVFNRFLLFAEYDYLISNLHQNSFQVGFLIHLGRKTNREEE